MGTSGKCFSLLVAHCQSLEKRGGHLAAQPKLSNSFLASDQVRGWLAAPPPQTKQRVRSALRGLALGRGDLKALRGELEGFNRLRVGGMRIVYSQKPGGVILLEYADTSDVIYENFWRILENRNA